ncbi:LysR substrate-binding domain-containing protein [Halomonas sp. M20]|uniref:LysR substrate-binding domain-containing protein n=1 Tax=Halomonas sp. M20 TaxID=2763264 RepID=UPI001D09C6E3|nr:LysR substrate-binding domain-containing protein [Halomonas sp. M20]
MSDLPPLRSLQVFEAVGRYVSIAEAARRLAISPAAVSQQVKLLEDALGLRLIEKDGRKIRLTQVGKKYHGSCSEAFESLRIASAEAKYKKKGNSLSISVLPSLLSTWLLPSINDWHRQNPGLDMRLEGSHAEPELGGNEIDFRITYSDRAREAENATELFRDCVFPVCSPTLLTQKMPLENPEDILQYPLLSIDWLPKFSSPPSWRDWFEYQQIVDRSINDSYRVYSLSAMAIQAAIKGQGFVLAQYAMVGQELEAGRLVAPFLKPLSLPSSYYFTWSNRVFDSAYCRQFHRWIIAQGKKQSDATEALFAASRE